MTNIQFIVFSVASGLLVAGVLALVAYIGKAVKFQLAAKALKFLTTTAGTLVMASMEEVRNLKDPLKPGTWGPEEAKRIKDRVLGVLKSLGARAIQELQEAHGFNLATVEALLDSLIEEQVEALRRLSDKTPPTTINVSPTPAPDPSK